MLQGRHSEAEKELLEAYRALEDIEGNLTNLLGYTANDLVKLYTAMGDETRRDEWQGVLDELRSR